MKYSKDKRIDQLVRQLIRQDWRFIFGGKHGRLRSPDDGTILFVPITPSDRRAFLNFRNDVRRAFKEG